MLKCFPCFSLLSCLFLLSVVPAHSQAVDPSRSGPAIPVTQPPAQDAAATTFKFTKIDLDLLADSNEIDRQYEKKGFVLHDLELQQYLDGVGKRVLDNRTAPENVTFQFKALRDPMVNAFALPNGSVYVTTGLLALLENEAELAAVLGHETSHVFERHTYLENRSMRKKALSMNILAIAGSVAPVGPGFGTTVWAFGSAVQLASGLSSIALVASVYGYSREKESEADSDGLEAMLAASYDPHAMARVFELLDQDSRLEYEPFHSFYHDHPELSERRTMALGFASSHVPATPRVSAEKDYLAVASPAICYNIGADINSRRARTALVRANRLATAFPNEPKYQILLGDAYRALGSKTPLPSEEELTHHGQSEHRKEYFKMTEQEEQTKLLETPEGKAMLHTNQAQAEKLYSGVAQSDPNYADAYRELGFLYEDESRYGDAAGEYSHYLALVSSTSLDHLRIQRRLAEVQKLQTPQTH